MRRLPPALLLPLALAVTAAAEEPQSFTFKFDVPGEATEFTQYLQLTKSESVGGVRSRTDEAHLETRIAITREEDGFRVAAEPVESTLTRDGQVVRDSTLARLANLRFDTVLDREGRLLRVEGIARFLGEVLAEAEPEFARTLRRALSIETLVAKEEADWQDRIGQFLGLTVTVGETFKSVAKITLPNGEEIEFQNYYTFDRTVPCGEATCLEMRQNFFTETEDDTEERPDRNLLGSYQSKSVQEREAEARLSGSINGSVTRVIDPATLRIYGETSQRTVVFETPGEDGEPVENSQTESRSYAFAYDDAGGQSPEVENEPQEKEEGAPSGVV